MDCPIFRFLTVFYYHKYQCCEHLCILIFGYISDYFLTVVCRNESAGEGNEYS